MNNNYKTLQNEIYDLPVKREKGDFIEFLKIKFDQFHDTLKHFDGELGESIRAHEEVIGQQMNCIYSSLHSHYEGKPSYAYLQLAKCLERIRGHLWIQTVPINEKRENLYRVRTGNNEQYSRKELFHIPFESRSRIRRQRFSITGLPCLYLSTSIYTCWEELNRPDIKNMHVARYDLNESELKFLFMDQRTELIRRSLLKPYEELNDASKSHVENFILSFPIMLACSIQVENYNSEFIPEYIVPQNLLQWVIEQDEIHAIQYTSNKTRFKVKPIQFESETNIVIPTQRFNDKGYCEVLSEKIKLTNPISYNLLEIANDPVTKHKAGILDVLLNRKKHKLIELIKDEDFIYDGTIFGKLEKKLKDMSVDQINY